MGDRVHMGEMRNSYRIEVKGPLWRFRCGRDGNIHNGISSVCRFWMDSDGSR